MGRASRQQVKWSDNTRMLMFPLGVGGNGPTISNDTTCQGLPACSLCPLEFATGLLCFAAWQTSHELTILCTSAASPGQNHSLCILLVVQMSLPVQLPDGWFSQRSRTYHSPFVAVRLLSSYLQYSSPHLHTIQEVDKPFQLCIASFHCALVRWHPRHQTMFYNSYGGSWPVLELFQLCIAHFG